MSEKLTIGQLVARDRARQGLPERVTDHATLRRVAAELVRASGKSSASPTDQVNEAARSEAGHATQHDHRISAA